jgi:hypothetical protein
MLQLDGGQSNFAPRDNFLWAKEKKRKMCMNFSSVMR